VSMIMGFFLCHHRQDLKEIVMSWEEALENCVDRGDWHQCVAQCVLHRMNQGRFVTHLIDSNLCC